MRPRGSGWVSRGSENWRGLSFQVAAGRRSVARTWPCCGRGCGSVAITSGATETVAVIASTVVMFNCRRGGSSFRISGGMSKRRRDTIPEAAEQDPEADNRMQRNTSPNRKHYGDLVYDIRKLRATFWKTLDCRRARATVTRKFSELPRFVDRRRTGSLRTVWFLQDKVACSASGANEGMAHGHRPDTEG